MQQQPPKTEGFGSGALFMGLGVASIALLVLWFSMHPLTPEDPAATNANAAALLLIKQGKVADAEQKLEPFVAKTDCSADSCKQTLAALYATEGRTADVERVCRSLGGNTDAGTADKMHFLGAPMVMSHPKEARAILERSAKIYKTLYGAESAQYSKDLYNIGVCDVLLKKFQIAANEFTECIPLLKKGYGPESEIFKAATSNLESCKTALSTDPRTQIQVDLSH